ncbi:GumC family protein [Oricola indica]|uniref:GumC family protein n=1 Tax=Oricola indica TaxID=2872591 RepID=UPI003CCC4516
MQASRQMPSRPVGLDIWAILTVLRRRLHFVVLTAAAFVVVTIIYALMATPVYMSTASLLIDPDARQPFDDPNIPKRGIDEGSYIESQVAVIGSDSVLRPVVRQFNLKADEEFGDGGASTSLLDLLGFGSSDSGPTDEIARENAAVSALSKAVSASRAGTTRVISVSVESGSAEKSAKLAQGIAESYLADRQRDKQLSSAGIDEQIQERLAELRDRMRTAEAAAQEYKAANRLQSTGEDGLLTSQELAGLSTQLTEARATLAERQARYDQIAAFVKGGVSANSINEISTSPNVAELRSQYTTAVRTVANLEAELLPQHPRLIGARSEVRRLEGLLQAEAQDAADAAKVELGIARVRVANLSSAIEMSRDRSDSGDAAMIRLRELESDAQASRTIYESALSRANQISTLDEVVIPSARIIGPGLPAKSPVWPKKKLLVILGGFFGVMVGVALVIGGEVVRQLAAIMRNKTVEIEETEPDAEYEQPPSYIEDRPVYAEFDRPNRMEVEPDPQKASRLDAAFDRIEAKRSASGTPSSRHSRGSADFSLLNVGSGAK